MNESRRYPYHLEKEPQDVELPESTSWRRLQPHEAWSDRIMALAQGTLSEQERPAVEQHLETCRKCREAYHACLNVYKLLKRAAPRESLIRERGVAYEEAVSAERPPEELKMPPGLPPRLAAYKRKHVVPDPPPAQNVQLSAFRQKRLLAQDGLVQHVLAKHPVEDRHLQLQIIDKRLDETERKAFEGEAQRLLNLQHPNIVPVVDFGVENDMPFLVLEHVAAESLRRKHRPGAQLPLSTVVNYVRQIAQALNYAHQRGVVHQNMRPESLLSSGDKVRVSHFGLTAGTLRPNAESEAAGASFLYSAPEQLEGKPVAASDQYALAALVYEWLTGSPPFSGSAEEVIQHHRQTEPPSPRAKRPDLPPRLDAAIRQALAKEPKRRHADIQRFAEALIEAAQVVER